MTYEQGGIGAGLGVINEDDDTLTLVDRAQHHFTTSLSTVEISSLNAAKLVKEFRKFFNDAVSTGFGEHKTYVVKYDAKNQERIEKLTELLDKNDNTLQAVVLQERGCIILPGRKKLLLPGSNSLMKVSEFCFFTTLASTIRPTTSVISIIPMSF